MPARPEGIFPRLIQYRSGRGVLNHEALHFVFEERIGDHRITGVVIPSNPPITIHVADAPFDVVIVGLVRVPQERSAIQHIPFFRTTGPAEPTCHRIAVCPDPHPGRIGPTQTRQVEDRSAHTPILRTIRDGRQIALHATEGAL